MTVRPIVKIEGEENPYPNKRRKISVPSRYSVYELGTLEMQKVKSIGLDQTFFTRFDISTATVYQADVILDPKYRKEFKGLWQKYILKKRVDQKGSDKEMKEYVKCISSMNDQAADPYAKKVEIKFISSKIGLGLVAKEDIMKKSIIGQYGGILTKVESLKEEEKEYLFEFPETFFAKWGINGAQRGNFTRFMNHAAPKRANVSSVEIFYKNAPRVIFIAEKNIKKGQELRYDYGPEYWKRSKVELE